MIVIGEAPQLLTEFGMQQIAPAVFSIVELEPRRALHDLLPTT
jgi:hypothetical protein